MNSFNFKWLSYLKIKENKVIISLIIFLLICSSILGTYIPRFIAGLYKAYETKEFLSHLKIGVLVFFGQYLIKAGFSVTMSKYIKDLISALREELFKNWIYSQDKIMTDDEVYISSQKYTRGEFQARLINDIQSISDLVAFGSLGIILDFVFIISCMMSFFSIERFYGVSLILIQTIACVFLIWLSKFIGIYFRSVKKTSGELSRILSSVSQGFRQLFNSRKGDFSLKMTKPHFDEFLKKQLFANIWDASYYSLAESLFPLFLALIVILFPYSEVTSVAIFASLIDLIQRSINPIKGIAGKISNLQRARASILRVSELRGDLDSHSFYSEEPKSSQKCTKLEVKIDEFLYLGHDDDRVAFGLRDINFSLTKGEKIGILGQSGSGKSTLLKLLSGEIFSDKVRLKFSNDENSKLFDSSSLKNLNFLRSHISLISQDSYVFTDTLAYNITFQKEITPEFEAFWSSMREKIPYIKEWGIEAQDILSPQDISMGQKQLISALRYCYSPKSIVLFDEISSGLDGQLEKALSDFINYIQNDVMMIIVTHRIETLMDSQKILFLKDGSQVDFGKHEELSKKHDSYREFFTILESV